MSKKRLQKEIEELSNLLKVAAKSGNFFKQSEIELELAELWKDTETDTAIYYYECSLKSSKKAKNYQNIILAYRNLGEIFIQTAETEEDYARAFKFLNLQLTVADDNKDHGLIQLAYHTLAQAYVTEAQRFFIESINLTKALYYGRQCIEYLNLHHDTIDEDKTAIKLGKNSHRRRAGIYSVLADIYIKFGVFKRALESINSSIDYALKHSETLESSFLYHCYLVKLELLRGKPCLELVETTRNYAIKHKIKENRDVIERKYHMQSLTCNRNESAKLCEVIDYYLKQYENRTDDNADFFDSVLKFLYSFVFLKKNLSNTLTNNDRSVLYEELGDRACNAEFFELGLSFYEEMLRYAELEKNNERIYLACGSIMETARSLHDYKLAYSYQERVLRLVRELYPYDTDKIFFEECDLFYMEVRNEYNVGGASKDVQYHKFLSIIQTCNTYRKKATVLDEFVLFLAFYEDKKELQRWTAELEKCYKLKETEPVLQTYEEKAQLGLEPKERYELREYVSRFKNKKEREDVTWRNTKGESRLHEAAKIGNATEVEKLIRSGQNVNAVDYAGWTPLMEAVSHGHIDNVRILCQNGADVNAASSEGLVDEFGNVGPNGITPMMDACASGNIRIARLLLQFKVDLNLLNEKGETAVDILRNYIGHEGHHLSENDRKMCQSLLDVMERKTVKRPTQNSAPHVANASTESVVKRFCNGYNFSA